MQAPRSVPIPLPDRSPIATLLLLVAAACGNGSEPGTDEPPPLPLVAVSAGVYSTCGLGPAGELFCWGRGTEGELGFPAPEDCSGVPGEAPCATVPGRVELAGVATSVSVGGLHVCVRTASAEAFCWGDQTHGQIGAAGTTTACGSQSTSCAPTPQLVPIPEPVSAVSAGGAHSCALAVSGTAYCWGYGFAGRLGTGDGDTRMAPAAVAGDLRFSMVTAGGAHTCGIAIDGRAHCWGYNHLGQLGNGTTTFSAVPTPVATDLRFVEVVLGVAHTCARTAAGAAYCWGGGGQGQLGTAAALDVCEAYPCSRIPVPVAGGHAFTGLSAGGWTCGVTAAESFCWGAAWPDQGPPVPRVMRSRGSAGTPFVQISIGNDHACGAVAGQIAYCWGSDYAGKLGDAPGVAPESAVLPAVIRSAPVAP